MDTDMNGEILGIKSLNLERQIKHLANDCTMSLVFNVIGALGNEKFNVDNNAETYEYSQS